VTLAHGKHGCLERRGSQERLLCAQHGGFAAGFHSLPVPISFRYFSLPGKAGLKFLFNHSEIYGNIKFPILTFERRWLSDAVHHHHRLALELV
jgi:hypothetical protein